jgi:Phosphatidate cytidylyltransferase, mitochondrial
VRYGVISYEDIVRDLTHWETMLVSTMMQRPIKTIVKNDEIWEYQMKNLKSALALGALRTPNGADEAHLYENIVSINHYTAKYMHSLVDKEDEAEVVKDNFARFQQMYQPIWQAQFKEVFNLQDGKFEI